MDPVDKIRLKEKTKNSKLLKKFLINLTLTVAYLEKGFRFSLLGNFLPHLEVLCGNLSFQKRKGRSYKKLFLAILQS
jgi:hypothetical protein